MKTLHKTLIAACLVGTAMSATANPFYIDLHGAAAGGGDLGLGDSITGDKVEAQFKYQSETTIDLETINPGGGTLDVGDKLHTTGGLNVGGVFNLSNFDFNAVTSLSPSTDSEGMTTDSTLISPAGSKNWGLAFTMELDGEIFSLTNPTTVDSVRYTGGTIEIYLIRENGGVLEAKNAFDLTVIDSDPSNTSNFLILGNVSFSGNEDPALVNLFHLRGESCMGKDGFNDLVKCMPPVQVGFVIDQNLNDAVATIAPDGKSAKISGNHDGSIKFVPEPGTVLLLGAGLAGLGWSTRRARQKA